MRSHLLSEQMADEKKTGGSHPWDREITRMTKWWGEQLESCYPNATAESRTRFETLLGAKLRNAPVDGPISLIARPDYLSPILVMVLKEMGWSTRQPHFRAFTLARVQSNEALVSVGHRAPIENLLEK